VATASGVASGGGSATGVATSPAALEATSVVPVSRGTTVTGEASFAAFAPELRAESGVGPTVTGAGETRLTGSLFAAGTDAVGWVTAVDVFAATTAGAGARSAGTVGVSVAGAGAVAAAAVTGTLLEAAGDTVGCVWAVEVLAAELEGVADSCAVAAPAFAAVVTANCLCSNEGGAAG
jgi:hypothetical protein